MTTGSALPTLPQIRSTRAVDFVASLVRFRYSLPGCLPPCTDQTGILPQPPGTFTSRLSTDRSSSPLLDITTTATGLLCWRDSHPLEWQLVSLHGHLRPIDDVCAMSLSPPNSGHFAVSQQTTFRATTGLVHRNKVTLIRHNTEKPSLEDNGARQPISGRSDCLAKCRSPAESDGRRRSGSRRIGSSGSSRPIAACRFSGRLFC